MKTQWIIFFLVAGTDLALYRLYRWRGMPPDTSHLPGYGIRALWRRGRPCK